jgi:hypothetical protein
MALPPELTRLPVQSLDILRAFGRENLQSADVPTILDITGMSQRAVDKGIRGLVTKGYLFNDPNRVYYLTVPGSQAVQDIMAHDASQPQKENTSASRVHQQQLVAVLPAPLGAQETTTLQIGLDALPPVHEASQLVLRLSATQGTISPSELTLELSPELSEAVGEAYFTPGPAAHNVRFRIEALQLVSLTDIHAAGGMYFDVDLKSEAGDLTAWYGKLTLMV